jgi:hypothetical protein
MAEIEFNGIPKVGASYAISACNAGISRSPVRKRLQSFIISCDRCTIDSWPFDLRLSDYTSATLRRCASKRQHF